MPEFFLAVERILGHAQNDLGVVSAVRMAMGPNIKRIPPQKQFRGNTNNGLSDTTKSYYTSRSYTRSIAPCDWNIPMISTVENPAPVYFRFERAVAGDENMLIAVQNAAFHEDFLAYGECPAYRESLPDMERQILDGATVIGDIIVSCAV
ncbi:MAG TPA: hypothetical protein VIV61_03100 [Candidatus Ozemobacteraceae bacterium]